MYWVGMQLDVLKEQSYSGGSHVSATDILVLTYLMQGSPSLPNMFSVHSNSQKAVLPFRETWTG